MYEMLRGQSRSDLITSKDIRAQLMDEYGFDPLEGKDFNGDDAAPTLDEVTAALQSLYIVEMRETKADPRAVRFHS